MDAAPAAIFPKPKMAATIAMTRKVTVQRSMVFRLIQFTSILRIRVLKSAKYPLCCMKMQLSAGSHERGLSQLWMRQPAAN